MTRSTVRRCKKLLALLSFADVLAFSAPISAGTPSTVIVPGDPKHATPPPAPPTPRPSSAAAHSFSLTIASIDPPAPVAGKPITIAYVVRNLGTATALAHLSATVAGGYPQTAGGKPAVDTPFPAYKEVTGSLVVTGGPAGPDPIELTLSSSPCGAAAAANPSCAPTTYAQATTTVAFTAPPMVLVRIAGTTYTDLTRGDPADAELVASGYDFIQHVAGCRSGVYSIGNNGNDTFFKNKNLPGGVTLKSVDFSMYRVPDRLTSDYYPGGAGGAGSYGLKLVRDSGNALHVHWENACRGPYATLEVAYSISFEIEMPAGTDLGEATSDPAQQPYPPTSVNLTSLGVLPGSTNAAAATIPGPVGADLTWNGEAYASTFAPAKPGTVSAVYNDEPYPIVLIADSRLGDGCVPGGNVVLPAHTATTADQFAALYGSAHTPRVITACSQTARDTKQPIIVTLTFLTDCRC